MTISTVTPRGFCFGVQKAIDKLDNICNQKTKNLYVYNEIVHNTHIIKHYSNLGVQFIKSLDEIMDPTNSTIIFSAHGVSTNILQKAAKLGINIVDATCPIVSSNHYLSLKYVKNNYFIVIIGNPKHDEIVGLCGSLPKNSYIVIKNESQIFSIPHKDKMIYITQTTLNLDDTIELINTLKDEFPNIISPSETQICKATKDRQDAIKNIKNPDLVLVCGSKNSSNSTKLVEVAIRTHNCPAYLIDSIQDLDNIDYSKYKNIFVSSGASVPEDFTNEVVDTLEHSI